jgi:hypothetical protein
MDETIAITSEGRTYDSTDSELVSDSASEPETLVDGEPKQERDMSGGKAYTRSMGEVSVCNTLGQDSSTGVNPVCDAAFWLAFRAKIVPASTYFSNEGQQRGNELEARIF